MVNKKEDGLTIKDFVYFYDRTTNPENHKLEYLFEGVFPRKGIGLIVGSTTVGKSLLMLRIASCLALGESLAEPKFTKEEWPFTFAYPLSIGSTLYIMGEGKSSFFTRKQSAEIALKDAINRLLPPSFNNKLPIMPMFIRRRLVDIEQIVGIANEIESDRKFYESYGYPLRLIIFDTYVSCFNIHDENNNSEMQNLITTLNAYAEYFNCFILITAHPAKSKNSNKAESRGASTLVNSPEVVLNLKKVNESSHRTLSVTKMRDGYADKAKFSFIIEPLGDSAVLLPPSHDIPENIEIGEIKSLSESQETFIKSLEMVTALKQETTTDNVFGYYKEMDISTRGNQKQKSRSHDAMYKSYKRAAKKFKDIGLIFMDDKKRWKWVCHDRNTPSHIFIEDAIKLLNKK